MYTCSWFAKEYPFSIYFLFWWSESYYLLNWSYYDSFVLARWASCLCPVRLRLRNSCWLIYNWQLLPTYLHYCSISWNNHLINCSFRMEISADLTADWIWKIFGIFSCYLHQSRCQHLISRRCSFIWALIFWYKTNEGGFSVEITWLGSSQGCLLVLGD